MSSTTLTYTEAGEQPVNDSTERIFLRSPPQSHQSGISTDIQSRVESLHFTEEIPENAFEIEDVPDGGYGWVCTLCVFLVNAHTWGVNSAWAVFLDYYLTHKTFPSASRLEYALVGGLSISQSLLMAPVQALSVRYLGSRITLLIGTFLVSAALFAASYATEIWHLLLTQGVCFGWGMGFLYITVTGILPQWFSTKRSLAVGLSSAGAGIGGLAYNLGMGYAVQTLGLAWSYRVLAFCALASNGVSALLLRDRNKTVRPTQTALNWREYRRVEVLLLSAWGFFTELGYIVLLYSLANYATAIGLSHSQGAIVSACLNLGLGVGRPVVGYASDVFGRINVATLCTLACGLFCLALWIPATSYAPFIVFALAAGVCCGTFWGTVGPVAADVTGLKRFPSIFGMVCLTLVVPTTFAEPIALEIVDTSGYISAQVFVGAAYLLGAASVWCLRSFRIHQIEQKGARERHPDPSRFVSPKRDFWLSPRRLFLPKRV